jgi:hypothetical protein
MKYCLLTLSLLFVLASCNKPGNSTPDRENMLRQGKWKMTDMAHTYLLFKPGVPPVDTVVHDTLKECDRDDYLVFGPGFNGTINSGATKCIPNAEPDQINFRWQPNNNDTGITLFGANAFGAADTSFHYIASVPGAMPVFTDPYTATFKSFSQSVIVLDVYTTYTDPLDNKKVDTSFWDYTFVNF